MMLGLSFETFTLVHVSLSAVGIVTGLVAIIALAQRRWVQSWHVAFLLTTAATVITGFMFPIAGLTPALIVGAVTSIALVIAIWAYAKLGSAASAPVSYAISATVALYLNLFVLVAQGFMKVSALNRLAPTQAEPPFAVAQAILLGAMIALGFYALRGIRLQDTRAA